MASSHPALRFATKKVIAAGAILAAVTFLTYAMFSFAPDPAVAILGIRATPEQLAAKRTELGFDDPLLARYGDWLFTLLTTGDFGASWFSPEPVSSTIARTLPVTLSITLVAAVVATAIGVSLGLVAALRGGWLDKVLQAIANLTFAIPALWIALILVIVFAIGLRWFPPTGYVPLEVSPEQWIRSLILPAIAIAIGGVATIANQTRSDVLIVLQQEYIRTLRGRGIPLGRLMLRHVLPNAAPKIITVVGLQVVALFGGALIVEEVFAMNGFGVVAASAALRSDIPLVMGIVTVASLVVVLINLASDLAVIAIDPKERSL